MKSGSSYRRLVGLTLWHGIRLPALMLLVILEPVVSFVFGGLALMGVLTTLFFWALGMPHFPALTMLLLSLGFGFTAALYQAVIRVLSA